MFIRIKYGDDGDLLLNPDCGSVNFLLHLKSILTDQGLYKEDNITELDLCDTDGTIKDLRKMGKTENVSSVVSNKDMYVPVKIQTLSGDDDENTDYQLLLATNDKMHEKLKAKLLKQKTARLNPNEKSTKSSNGKHGLRRHETPKSTQNPPRSKSRDR